MKIKSNTKEWTQDEIKLLLDMEYTKKKSFDYISRKLHRTVYEIKEKLSTVKPDTIKQPPIEILPIKPPTIQCQSTLSKPSIDPTPSKSVAHDQLVLKRLNDIADHQRTYQRDSGEKLSLLHQDLLGLEIKLIKKFDDIIQIANKNTSLKQQELDIIKTQFEVWKQKNNK